VGAPSTPFAAWRLFAAALASVKVGRCSAVDPATNASRPRLDRRKRGGTLCACRSWLVRQESYCQYAPSDHSTGGWLRSCTRRKLI
jgi:hypothetical protein